jgi:CRISP-associated protein Cas1
VVWRSVVISRPAKLRREHFSLAIEQEQTAHVPFEDIAVIVLNHREITLTHPVLSACAEYGIGLYATGSNHQPAGVFLPFLSHTRTTRLLRLQLDIARPLVKQVWAGIVRRKIENQAACLRLSITPGEERLASLARRVRSGDAENLEAQAAAFYFPQLYGSAFRRSDERWINAALNYGYAILRGAIARGLVAHALHPTIGLFHDSEQNAFNLADDLIEPYRPLVDLHVAKHATVTADTLCTADKAALISLLNVDVGMPQGEMSVLSAIDYSIESLVRILESDEDTDTAARLLELPHLIGLRTHALEY